MSRVPHLAAVAREVEQFVAAAGWDQPPQLFALVPTAALLASQPSLADQLDSAAPLTPVAQDALPDGELDVVLAGIEWPDGVAGCALAQEIVVLPPAAEAELGDDEQARRAAAEHPDRQEARLVAAVLRDGDGACVLRLRGVRADDDDDDEGGGSGDEVIERPDLAPNLVSALRATLR